MALTVSFIVSFSRGYREMEANTELLERLGRQTGGEVLHDEDLSEGLECLFTPDPAAAGSFPKGSG